MGRYGNQYLINGEEEVYQKEIAQKKARIYLTNVSNARPYRVSVPDAYLRVLGSDLGYYDAPREVEEVIISPAERYIIEVEFPDSGEYSLVHRSDVSTTLARFDVEVPVRESQKVALVAELPDDDILEEYGDREFDHELELSMEM